MTSSPWPAPPNHKGPCDGQDHPSSYNDTLDAWFRKQGYNTKDQEYDVIYVNGDNNLENLKKPDQTWKVRLIEEEFLRRMFDVQDV